MVWCEAGIRILYTLGTLRSVTKRWAAGLIVATLPVTAPVTTFAQQRQPPPLPLATTREAALLADLPSAGNLFSLLETTQAEIISDRFSGGVNQTDAARLGAFLTSWTQTAFRIDDVDISSAVDGRPMFVPPVTLWQRVNIWSGTMPADASGPGLLVSLEPMRPSTSWRADAVGSGSGDALVSSGGRLAAPISKQSGFAHVSGTVGGPIVPGRVAMLAAASTTRASQFERDSATSVSGAADTLYVQLHVTPRTNQEIRTLGWRQVTRNARRETSTHVQSTWTRPDAVTARWRIFGAFTQRAWDRTPGGATEPTIERLLDGPVPALVGAGAGAGAGSERRWSAGGRAGTAPRRVLGASHALQAGLDAGGASLHGDAARGIVIRERIGGVPARLWSYAATPEVHRSRETFAAFISNRAILADAVTLDGTLRFDRAAGRAQGASQEVAWNSWLPRAAAHWSIGREGGGAPGGALRGTLFASYSRTANALGLDLLAWGDPAAPAADVFRWAGGPETGPLVARAGPGATASGALARIDPALARPITRELTWGGAAPLPGRFQVRLVRVIKRAAHLVAAVNTGAPASSYTTTLIPDPGANLIAPEDDQMLPLYNRTPASFGQDLYVLSNPSQPEAKFRGWVLVIDRSTPRVYLSAGGTMQFTDAPAGSRGFLAVENDLADGGELFSNPNAATHAKGNLFLDRQYTGKVTSVIRFADDFRVGAVARYQDGQPFARIVVAEGLNQGAEAIRAFRNGKSRFTFTGTLDVRVRKGFRMPGGHRADLVVDAYNVLDLGKEVEEWVGTGPAFRTPTAVQPPLTIHVGIQYRFARTP